MRTTLTLEEDVAARLKAEARRTGVAFKVLVNEVLRAGLARRRATRKIEPFSVKARDLGALGPGVALVDIGGLLEHLDGARDA